MDRAVDHRRRQRSRGTRRLQAERRDRHLPDHALVAHGRVADAWAAAGKKNLFGEVPRVLEMQSEAGAAGAVHGALQAGALTTTFTASQGLLLMIPEHVQDRRGVDQHGLSHRGPLRRDARASRSSGTTAMSMAARQTGWAMLFASSVQEALDFSLIAQAATFGPACLFFTSLTVSAPLTRCRRSSTSATKTSGRWSPRSSSAGTGSGRSRRKGPSSAGRRKTRTSSSNPAKRPIPTTWPPPPSYSR